MQHNSNRSNNTNTDNTDSNTNTSSTLFNSSPPLFRILSPGSSTRSASPTHGNAAGAEGQNQEQGQGQGQAHADVHAHAQREEENAGKELLGPLLHPNGPTAHSSTTDSNALAAAVTATAQPMFIPTTTMATLTMPISIPVYNNNFSSSNAIEPRDQQPQDGPSEGSSLAPPLLLPTAPHTLSPGEDHTSLEPIKSDDPSLPSLLALKTEATTAKQQGQLEEQQHPLQIDSNNAAENSNAADQQQQQLSVPSPAIPIRKKQLSSSATGPRHTAAAPPSSSPFTKPSSPLASRPCITLNTNAKELALKNAVVGGLLSSPTSMPPMTYVSKFLTSSSNADSHNKNNKSSGNGTTNQGTGSKSHESNMGSIPKRRTSKKRTSISSISGRSGVGPMKSGSALSAFLAAQSSSGTGLTASNLQEGSADANTAATTTAPLDLNKYAKRPDIRPYYPSFGNMGGFIRSPRSMSYGTPTSTGTNSNINTSSNTRTGSPASSTGANASGEGSVNNDALMAGGQHGQNDHPSPYGLRKSQSMSKAGKKALTTRFRKMRQRRGSKDSVGSNGSGGMTSGESDSESLMPEEGPSSLGSGFARKLTVSMPKQRHMDPTLPPPPPIRTNSNQSRKSPSNSIPAYAVPYGFGSMGAAPLSVVTRSGGVSAKHPASISEGSGFAAWGTIGAGSNTGTSTPSIGEHGKESSTTRFKEMIKRNVGLTSASTPTAAANSDMLLSGDEQYSSLFSVSRLTGRHKKLTKHAPVEEGPCLLTSDEEEAILASMRENPYGHHFRTFLPHLHRHRHHYHLHRGSDCEAKDEQLLQRSEKRQKRSVSGHVPVSIVHTPSLALAEARQLNQDPNVLLVEIEPLPNDFMQAFAALKESFRVAGQTPLVEQAPASVVGAATANPVATSTLSGLTKLPSVQQLPLIATALPSATMMSPTSATSATASINTISTVNSATATATARGGSTHPIQTSSPALSAPPTIPPLSRSRALKHDIGPLAPRSFLFKSYQNSKFQGHYCFRVRGENVEYGRLPRALEQACSQYFREADVTYRKIESKAKGWGEERKVAMAKREEEFEEVRRTSTTLSHLSALQQEMNLERDLCGGDYGSGIQSGTDSGTDSAGDPQEPSDASVMAETETAATRPILVVKNRGHLKDHDPVLTESPASMKPPSSSSILAFPGKDIGVDAITRTPDPKTERTQQSALAASLNQQQQPPQPQQQQKQRRDSDSLSHISLASNMSPTRGSSPTSSSPNISYEDRADSDMTAMISHQYISDPEAIFSTATDIATTRLRQDSFVRDYQGGFEQQQRLIDEAYCQSVEVDHFEEARQQLYGLEAYLSELTTRVEYERFEVTANVEIVNENRETALFSIVNGDKTNIMWLESPSVKQKYEFLNWITVSLMDYDEPDPQAIQDAKKKHRLSAHESILFGHDQILDRKDVDYLLDIADVRLSLLQAAIHAQREATQHTMSEFEDTLGKLEDLDENAKKLAATLSRGIESRELRNSLQPSLTTGLTLAQTVDAKIRDVNERIVVCARIMGAARLNLNRLKYEIELEQRSMRLFRQYKIAIAVATISILGLFWFLYYRHRVAAAVAASGSMMPVQMLPFSPSPMSPLLSSMSLNNNPLPTSDLNQDKDNDGSASQSLEFLCF